MKIINRDLSWLAFDGRVLEEAMDPDTPLLEKLKFISIVSSNLDEFFMVRIANLMHSASADPAGEEIKILPVILSGIEKLVKKQYSVLEKKLLPDLGKAKIRVLNWEELSAEARRRLRKMAEKDLASILTPIGIDRAHSFPIISNLALELLIRLEHQDTGREEFALMEVPAIVPRFIRVPDTENDFILQEELISHNHDVLFRGYAVRECSAFRITRDMDFSLDEDQAKSGDFLSMVHETVTDKVRSRNIVRLEVSSEMSKDSRKWLAKRLSVPEINIFNIPGMLDLKSLMFLGSLPGHPELLYPPMPPLPSIHFRKARSLFDSIRKEGPFLIHHPFESFDPVVGLIEEAAEDPNVLAVKQTLYRAGGNSPVVAALMKAAGRGKQVSVLVELKARFDEENNVIWAQELARAGAHVIYGVANLKVHCKMLLITRKEKEGIRQYVHLSTGNYNPATARQYTDIGFFTCDPAIASDCSSLFNILTGFSTPPEWNALIVAPFTLEKRLKEMIDREAALSTPEHPGSIRIKINALIDEKMIQHLCNAARNYVKIELAVRGLCTLNPECLEEKFRKNITVVSIVDRFLEHSRIYRFGNGGSPEYYAGSADIMPRNLRRRIEILYPVTDPESRKELDMILNAVISDRRKGRLMTGPCRYSSICTAEARKKEKTRSQYKIYEFYRKRLAAAGRKKS